MMIRSYIVYVKATVIDKEEANNHYEFLKAAASLLSKGGGGEVTLVDNSREGKVYKDFESRKR